jgi:hypothetical protein
MTSLQAIQTANLDKKADDDVYILVTGAAKGQPINERLPQGKTWQAAPKKIPVDAKSPVTLWKGDLNDGEFALVTVTVMQGKGADDAKVKEYLSKITAAEKDAAGTKTLATVQDMRKLAGNALKGERAVVTKIKDLFSREKKTDHYGGLFNVVLWNNNGKIVKRLDPVGLTFGEHYGDKEKIYTKLKNTRNNVPVREASGEYSLQALSPTNDEQTAVRVKMLENEYIKTPERDVKNTTDYLAEIVVTAAGKPLKWNLPDSAEQQSLGENVTRIDDDIHRFWDWAE